jgi:hypothetical protein
MVRVWREGRIDEYTFQMFHCYCHCSLYFRWCCWWWCCCFSILALHFPSSEVRFALARRPVFYALDLPAADHSSPHRRACLRTQQWKVAFSRLMDSTKAHVPRQSPARPPRGSSSISEAHPGRPLRPDVAKNRSRVIWSGLAAGLLAEHGWSSKRAHMQNTSGSVFVSSPKSHRHSASCHKTRTYGLER